MLRRLAPGEKVRIESSHKSVERDVKEILGTGNRATMERRLSEYVTSETGVPAFVRIRSVDPLRYDVALRQSGEFEGWPKEEDDASRR